MPGAFQVSVMVPPRITGSGLAEKDRICGGLPDTEVGREVGFEVLVGVAAG
jgi:hypothetical protein